MVRYEISDGWRLTELPREGAPEHNHLPAVPATVPGHVHADLKDAGVIPDPFHRLQEHTVSWVDESDWVYQTEFSVPSLLSQDTYLVFHGLDTIAEIELNGQPLGNADNMHIKHEFYVGDRLNVGHGKSGSNSLKVTLRSAKRIGNERMLEWNQSGNDTASRHWDFWDVRAFVRKAQFMYGWDWGPVLISCGIWKPVELVQVTHARILDYSYSTEFDNAGTALVTVDAYFERASLCQMSPMSLAVSLNGDPTMSVAVDAPQGAGRLKATAIVKIQDPKIWQPNGLGEANLYQLEITIGNDRAFDRAAGNIGLRIVELVREPDADALGEGFKFRINGSDVFAKGANWIPSFSFPSESKIADQIRAARDAGFNMLRVWGGGLYESEEFYRECDRNGIMVWQDFAYACSYYPDRGQYAQGARDEAVSVVRKLRGHPSLVLWCGNNENHMMYHTDWGTLKPTRHIGEAIYHEVLPEVLAAEDPGRPYWPSSPFGGDDPNSQDSGDHHNWDVWHGHGDWVHYASNKARFVSEFGFAAACGLAAWSTCLDERDRTARSAAVRWHDKTRKGYDTYLGYIAKHFPVPETLRDLVYYSQLNQAEALKFGIEHYRRNKGRCWGTLFWQLNDCWPTQSWSIIDCLGEPKAAYYAAKRFYAPVLLSLVRVGNRIDAYIVNDKLEPVSGTLDISLGSLQGRTITESRSVASVDSNSVALIAAMDISSATGHENEVYVQATFTPNEGDVVDNVLLLVEPKDLHICDANVQVSVSKIRRDDIVLELSSSRFTPYVWIRRSDEQPLHTSDNFFHLLPDRSHLVTISNVRGVDHQEFLGALVVESLCATGEAQSVLIPSAG